MFINTIAAFTQVGLTHKPRGNAICRTLHVDQAFMQSVRNEKRRIVGVTPFTDQAFCALILN